MNDKSDDIQIFFNPKCSKCSKCRISLDLIQQHGIQPDVVEYLQQPPDAQTLSDVLDMLGLEPRELMRRGEAIYKELQLEDKPLSREQLIQIMIENPILIERPIVIRNGKAVIGRPPEKILDLIS